MVQVEWEDHPGSDTWEPIKNIVKDAREEVIGLLQKYERKEELPKYLRKMIETESGSIDKNQSKKQKVTETIQNNTKDQFKCQNIHKNGSINKLEIEWDARYGYKVDYYLYQKKCYGCKRMPSLKGIEMDDKKYFRITKKKPCHVCEFMKNGGNCTFYYCDDCYTDFAKTNTSNGIDDNELLKLNIRNRCLRNRN